jgi:hypothetical protein
MPIPSAALRNLKQHLRILKVKIFLRDQQGLEVDFLAPGRGGRVRLIEVKWTKTISPALAAPLRKLIQAIKTRPVEAVIVHRSSRGGEKLAAVAPGVKATSVEGFLARF